MLVRPLDFVQVFVRLMILKLKMTHFILPSDNAHLLLQSSDLRESKPFCRIIRDFLCYLTSSNYDSKNRHLKKQHETIAGFFTKYISHRDLRNFPYFRFYVNSILANFECKSPESWPILKLYVDSVFVLR